MLERLSKQEQPWIILSNRIFEILINMKLSFIDTNTKRHHDITVIDTDHLIHDNLGSHWYLMEARRLDALKTLHLIGSRKRDLLRPFIVTRLFLTVPPEWADFYKPSLIGTNEERDDLFYLIRRKTCQAIKDIYLSAISSNTITVTMEESSIMINLICERIARCQDPTEQQCLTETVVGLTSAIGHYESSRGVIEKITAPIINETRVSSSTHYTNMIQMMIEDLSLKKTDLKQFIVGDGTDESITQATMNRRLLCRGLSTVDSLTTSLLYPGTIGQLIGGGFVEGSSSSCELQQSRRRDFMSTSALNFDYEKKIDSFVLDMRVNVAQSDYVELLLPLMFDLLSLIIEQQVGA